LTTRTNTNTTTDRRTPNSHPSVIHDCQIIERQLHIVSNNICARIRKYVSYSITGVSVHNELILRLIVHWHIHLQRSTVWFACMSNGMVVVAALLRSQITET